MGKKKFIDKKKSATFQLLARDSSDPSYDGGPSGDRIFVRVDDNPYSVDGFFDDDEDNNDVGGIGHPGYSLETNVANDPNSIFADASGDDDDDDDDIDVDGNNRFEINGNQNQTLVTGAVPLSDHVRREILELGLPDDGYNYLSHLREIKNTGGGSAYYHNSKAKIEQLPLDVKAYDASKVRTPLSLADGDASENSMYYTVAAKSVGLRMQKAVDPEVSALLDDGDSSRFGSDVEDLEEDFVVSANLPEEKEVVLDKNMNSVDPSRVMTRQEVSKHAICYAEEQGDQLLGCDASRRRSHEAEQEFVTKQPRARRLLDEQFDMLTLQEYDTDSDYDNDGSIDAEGESLADKINHVLIDHVVDELELDDKYKVPADFLHKDGGSNSRELVDSASDVIRRCVEYAEMFNENEDNEDVMVLEESSDESAAWDCETIVTTYSNLDNLPGKIEAPGYGRKKKLAETVSKAAARNHVISLHGKEKLPVEFLPHSRKAVVEKVKKAPSTKPELSKRRSHGEESKEEKKERKATVKEERREARRAKKELKGLYQSEAQRAQRVAAVSGPSSVHVM